MHLVITESHIPFSGHCDLDLLPSFKNYCVGIISLILFEVEIPNLVCGCILIWRVFLETALSLVHISYTL